MTQTNIINRQYLKMHQSLRKIESSLITQIKSKKIDLASFLFYRRVLDVFSSIYFCDWHQQTIKHVIMFYKQFDRETLKRELNIYDYRIITSSSRTLKILVAWFMQLNLLSQFSLTKNILYEWSSSFFSLFFLLNDHAVEWGDRRVGQNSHRATQPTSLVGLDTLFCSMGWVGLIGLSDA
jgi:hypothetical protein